MAAMTRSAPRWHDGRVSGTSYGCQRRERRARHRQRRADGGGFFDVLAVAAKHFGQLIIPVR